jgi:hypothetical protein
MGDKNVLLATGIVLVALAAAVFNGLGFYYDVEGEAIDAQIAMERRQKTRLTLLIEGDPQKGEPGVVQKVDALANPDVGKGEIARIKKEIGATEQEGLQARIKDSAAAAGANDSAAVAASEARKKDEEARVAEVAKAVNELGAAFKEMEAAYGTFDTERRPLEDDLSKLQAEMLGIMESGHGKNDNVREEIAGINSRVALLEGKLKRMRERRERLEELRQDGEVLSADAALNMAVVSLGQRQGVRPGMTFEIFELKRDGEKLRKGKLRLTRVESQQSFARLLPASEVPKVCPQCGWKSDDITHLFCTYCLGGDDEKEKEAQRLSEGSVKDRVIVPDFLNPVGKGDFISSPFFLGRLKERAFTFAVIGQTARHSRQEMAAFLKENGCSLGGVVGLDTDFAIVGIGPKVVEEMEAARKLGVSVIRESELFDFFGSTGISPDVLPTEAAAGTP